MLYYSTSNFRLRLKDIVGSGTGLLIREEVWYDISLDCIPEVLRFTDIYAAEQENALRAVDYRAEITNI